MLVTLHELISQECSSKNDARSSLIFKDSPEFPSIKCKSDFVLCADRTKVYVKVTWAWMSEARYIKGYWLQLCRDLPFHLYVVSQYSSVDTAASRIYDTA